MAQAYSAGLTVTDNIVLRKERILPLKGEVRVKEGDRVKADDIVAHTSLPVQTKLDFSISKTILLVVLYFFNSTIDILIMI